MGLVFLFDAGNMRSYWGAFSFDFYQKPKEKERVGFEE
jgi:hypothetical protein